jgi:hypothetical protein
VKRRDFLAVLPVVALTPTPAVISTPFTRYPLKGFTLLECQIGIGDMKRAYQRVTAAQAAGKLAQFRVNFPELV